MYNPKSAYTKLALEAITDYVKNRKVKKVQDIPDELSVKQACFVSIHEKDGSLRGCIGTIEPQQDNLAEEIIHDAISAATEDFRFTPLTPDELDNIDISVDVLSIPEKINQIDQLEPKKYGVIVSDGVYRKGLLLPDIEGIDTVEDQLSIAKRKAGIYELENDELKIYRFTTTRFF